MQPKSIQGAHPAHPPWPLDGGAWQSTPSLLSFARFTWALALVLVMVGAVAAALAAGLAVALAAACWLLLWLRV